VTDPAADATAGEAGDDRLAFCDGLCIFYQQAVVIVYKSVAAAEHSKRRERGEMAAECGFAVAQGAEMIALRADDADIERGETLTGHAGAGRNVLVQKPNGELLEFVG
jgi:hypothetical protein